MSWLDRLFKDNKTKEIECELLDETENLSRLNMVYPPLIYLKN